LRFRLTTAAKEFVDKTTGEIAERLEVGSNFEQEPLYTLWHILYSLEEAEATKKLKEVFSFEDEIIKRLIAEDFTKGGFGNKSARFIRKILPYLQKGLTYDKACAFAGYNHSNSLTKEENLKRELVTELRLLPKNTLRQPIVEKILNQVIHLVNAIIKEYGKPDTIRVELARELRQSKDERNMAYATNNKRERESKKIIEELMSYEYFKSKGRVSKRELEKYRLWLEFGKISPYEPNKPISLEELYSNNYDIEHIIPRSLRFDDSFGNKTICPRRYNSGSNAKNNFTAYDYMAGRRTREDFDTYIAFIEKAYKEKAISKGKYEKLLMQGHAIPTDFIARQLNETRYISRKAKEILLKVCYHVHSTSGAITSRLRDLWGWDEVLELVNLPKYRQLDMTEQISYIHNGQTHWKEIVKGWTKRDDHRHHAIDALAIACTRQGFIQRLNTLNAQHTRDEMFNETKDVVYKDKLSLVEKYLLKQKPPFNTAEVIKHIENINISFKPGKKVATISKYKQQGKNIETGILAPRGPLSEESVYGKVNRKITCTVKLDKNFTQVDDIVNNEVKLIVKERLLKNNGNFEKAFANLKKEPLLLVNDANCKPIIQVEIFSFTQEYVIKYPVTSITVKDLPFVVDKQVREILTERLKQFNHNHKEAFKDIGRNPIWLNKDKGIPIKTVRCYTGISHDSVVPIKVKDKIWQIEYEKFVKPGSNHHIAIYKDKSGKLQEHVVSFWHAVERKKYGIPVIIKQPSEEWTKILDGRELPESFLNKLPIDTWTFITSMQQNESFVFNMQKEELNFAIQSKNYRLISPNLFRVRKLTSGAYWFNQQFETTPRESMPDKKSGRCVQASVSSMTGIKVKVNSLGDIFMTE
jgi:CRISPR-associated endonuclease Csn1